MYRQIYGSCGEILFNDMHLYNIYSPIDSSMNKRGNKHKWSMAKKKTFRDEVNESVLNVG